MLAQACDTWTLWLCPPFSGPSSCFLPLGRLALVSFACVCSLNSGEGPTAGEKVGFLWEVRRQVTLAFLPYKETWQDGT